MDIYDEAGLNESWARYWLAMDGWTIDEAACLLCGVSPSEHNLTQLGQRQSFDLPAQLEYEACFKVRRNLLQRSAETRVLTFPARPGAVIEWAMGKGMRLPALLIPVDMEVRSGNWVKQGTPLELVAQNTATPAPVVTVSDGPAPSTVSNWKMLVQAEATAHCLRLRKSGANPTKHSIVEAMATWCRDNDIRTETKIHPSANYLRTHVLGGKHWDVPH